MNQDLWDFGADEQKQNPLTEAIKSLDHLLKARNNIRQTYTHFKPKADFLDDQIQKQRFLICKLIDAALRKDTI